jgi:SAM-dependent methyltransferase
LDWDEYWTGELGDERSRTGLVSGWQSPLLEVIVSLGDPPPWRSLLVVGCGISTEPAAFAHMGYDVVAFDISQVAIAYVEAHPATPEQLVNWIVGRAYDHSTGELLSRRRRDDDELRRILELHRREGGSLVTQCSGFRELAVQRTFDIVYCPNSWRCLEPEDRAELARRAFAWLAPGGMCLVSTMNLSEKDEEALHRDFSAAGLFERDPERRVYDPERPRYTTAEAWKEMLARSRALRRENTRRALERLAAGEKMYDAYNESG